MKRMIMLSMFIFVFVCPYISLAEESLESFKKEIRSYVDEKVSELETHASSTGKGKSVADLNGYVDFSFEGNNTSAGQATFHARTLSLFVGKEVERWRLFSELEFADGVTHACNTDDPSLTCPRGQGVITGQGAVNLETVWMEYSHNDKLHIRGGILLVPTYWRVNHYPSVTLSTEAPLMNEEIFPPSLTGVMVYGKKYFGSLGADYRVYVGNGEGDGTNNPAQQDNQDHKAVGSKVVLDVPSLDLFDRFQVAGHFYQSIPTQDNRNTIWGGELIVDKYPFALLGEYGRVFMENSGAPQDKVGYYIQPSYHLLSNIAVFYRYDALYLNASNLDPDGQFKNTLGVNYHPIPEISLKAEYYNSVPSNPLVSNYNGAVASAVFFF